MEERHTSNKRVGKIVLIKEGKRKVAASVQFAFLDDHLLPFCNCMHLAG